MTGAEREPLDLTNYQVDTDSGAKAEPHAFLRQAAPLAAKAAPPAPAAGPPHPGQAWAAIEATNTLIALHVARLEAILARIEGEPAQVSPALGMLDGQLALMPALKRQTAIAGVLTGLLGRLEAFF